MVLGSGKETSLEDRDVEVGRMKSQKACCGLSQEVASVIENKRKQFWREGAQ